MINVKTQSFMANHMGARPIGKRGPFSDAFIAVSRD
jgi:hypothetical protein